MLIDTLQKDLSSCRECCQQRLQLSSPAQMASAAESCLVQGCAYPGWPTDSGGEGVGAEAQAFGTNMVWDNSDGLVNSGAPVRVAEAIQYLDFFCPLLFLPSFPSTDVNSESAS